MIEHALLIDIAAAAEREGLDAATLRALRLTYPDLHFTLCSDDDIPPRLASVLARDGFNVYLADAREHCVRLTADSEEASGVVFATVTEDD